MPRREFIWFCRFILFDVWLTAALVGFGARFLGWTFEPALPFAAAFFGPGPAFFAGFLSFARRRDTSSSSDMSTFSSMLVIFLGRSAVKNLLRGKRGRELLTRLIFGAARETRAVKRRPVVAALKRATSSALNK